MYLNSNAFPNKRNGIHSCFSQWKCKSHSNLEQGLRVECKQGSEKTLLESDPWISELTEVPLCLVGHAKDCPSNFVSLCYGLICVLYIIDTTFTCSPSAVHFSFILKRPICWQKKMSGGWSNSIQKKRTWMEFFIVSDEHDCPGGEKRISLRQL